MLDKKRRNLFIIGVFLVISIGAYLQYQNSFLYWDAIGLFVESVDPVEEADVILLSEDALSRYHRISGVLSEVDEEGSVVLSYDRGNEMDEFYLLTQEHSLDLETDFVYFALGERYYWVYEGLYGGMESQPIYLNLAAVFGFLAILLSAIQVYFHFRKR